MISRKDFLRLAGRGAAASAVASAFGRGGPAAAQTSAAKPSGSGEQKGADVRGTTDAVVRFITTASMREFPAEVVQQGKRCLIDGFGVILAGSTVAGTAIVRRYVQAARGPAEASAFGPERLMTTAAQAALVNGASGHAMDFDDTQLSTTPDRTYGLLTHPTVPALVASLALAERMGASGASFLEAFLIGFEVECKICEAIAPDHYLRGFHSSGTVGTFGAAAAAARLLKLDAAQCAHALAIASSLASGIRVNFGSMTKPLHVGKAAEHGIFAAELAASGFTGGGHALDGQWGFFAVFGGGADPGRLIGALGRPHAIVNPGVSVKPYPCGVLSHQAMDAMLALVTEHDVKPEAIKAVRLRAGSNILDPLRYKTAKTELEAKFCPPFLLAAIALRRKAGMREFTDEFVSSEPVQRLMTKVTTILDPEIEAKGFDRIRSVVEVDLVDGRTLVQRADERYRGGPERPFTRAELHAKFTDCAGLALAEPAIRQALAQIESVDTLTSVRDLTRTLSSKRS
jgi:2-methylcitrate dehydratase PrpD